MVRGERGVAIVMKGLLGVVGGFVRFLLLWTVFKKLELFIHFSPSLLAIDSARKPVAQARFALI